jgi:uncharacterized protein with beta-barrel porin domain
MTIELKREGGFVGATDKTNVEFEQLTAEEQKTLNKLAESPAEVVEKSLNTNLRDAFTYSLAMKKDGKNVSLKFDDTTASPKIVAIFQKYIH